MEGKKLPSTAWSKGIMQSKTVSLLLRMCIPIFGSEKAVVLDSVFCFTKVITDIESKGVYTAALIKKWRYWPKGVPGNLIDNHFEDKEVSDVGMIEARPEDNKLFKMFFMKDLDYMTKIMTIWMTLNELEGERARRDFIDSSDTKETKHFTHQQQFGIHFRYRYQVDGFIPIPRVCTYVRRTDRPL